MTKYSQLNFKLDTQELDEVRLGEADYLKLARTTYKDIALVFFNPNAYD